MTCVFVSADYYATFSGSRFFLNCRKLFLSVIANDFGSNDLSRSNKRLSKGTGEKVAIAQFHQQSSSSAEIPPPPVKKAPPPPRAEKYSSIERVPPKPHIKSGRGGLLSEIHKGTKLKRTVTNDRSAPRVWYLTRIPLKRRNWSNSSLSSYTSGKHNQVRVTVRPVVFEGHICWLQ